MKDTIEKLWNGEITPAEKCGADDPELEELITLLERHKEALGKKLDRQQKDIFEKYLDCVEEYIYFTSMHAFSDGFCLASKLMCEALSEKR